MRRNTDRPTIRPVIGRSTAAAAATLTLALVVTSAATSAATTSAPTSAARSAATTSATTVGARAALPGRQPEPGPQASGRHTEIDNAASLQRALEREARSANSRRPTPHAKNLQAQLDTLVTDGAVGVSARVDGPAFDWAGASGLRERGTHRKASKNDQFRVASNTKMMIATLVMQEVDRGTWTLNSKANEVVPGLFPGHDVTIEQLLSHLSGAPDALGELVVSRMAEPTWTAFFRAIGARYTDAEFIEMANALPWTEPGTKWSYSNAGYVALGVMLQKVTGSDIGSLLEKRVFAPAGMRHTTYPVKSGTRGPFLVGAGFTPEGVFSTANFNPALFSSAGAVVSTTADLNRFTDALLDGRLVSKKAVNDMTTPRLVGDLGYGLGLMRLTDPCPSANGEPTYLYGHDGGAYGTVSMALSSADGERQVSLGVTGRYYSDTDPTQSQPFDLNTALVALLRASC